MGDLKPRGDGSAHLSKAAQARRLAERGLNEQASGHPDEADRLLEQAQDLDPNEVAEVLREHDAGRAPDARLQELADRDVKNVLPRISLAQLRRERSSRGDHPEPGLEKVTPSEARALQDRLWREFERFPIKGPGYCSCATVGAGRSFPPPHIGSSRLFMLALRLRPRVQHGWRQGFPRIRSPRSGCARWRCPCPRCRRRCHGRPTCG